ncbi:unnamed protein product [Microthlaspi erraticum]|uniref:Uncharacterized protein n=1 Tax=Microthlaspi erraticum TaxID=1685480 RepID=A0A6D2K1Z1_9BRAS|nr:unnamed protein product [Microthlaspi erraticum]
MDYMDDSFDETAPERVRFKSRIRVGSEGDKYAKVTRMLLDIVFWAMNNDDAPQNFMLISKPFENTTKCDVVIQALERRGVNIIFRPSDQVASIDQSTVDIFASLCKRLPVDAEMHFNESIKSQGRILTEQSEKLGSKGVAVFWLADYCPCNPRKIWSNVRLALKKKGYKGVESTFTMLIDKGRYLDDVMKEVYDKAGVYDIAVSEEDKCGKVTRMLREMISWRRFFLRPANFVVISEPFIDPICDRVVEGFKLRGCNVLFELPDYMLTFGSSRWSADQLLGDSFP